MNNNNTDTTDLTTELSKLTVNQTTNSDTTPVSPNKGTVVFWSYKLHRHATDTDSLTASVPQDSTSTSSNVENEIQMCHQEILRDPHPWTSTR